MGSGRVRRFWVDPRFAVGIGLVAASVTGVGVVLADADEATTVFVARGLLSVGDRIVASDLGVTRVRFDAHDRLYLIPGRLPPDGLVVTRTVAGGELVPMSAVGTREGESVTSVVVDVRSRLASAVKPGATVDVWSARAVEQSRFGPPSVLVGDATIVRLVEASGLLADAGSQSVEILVPTGSVAAVLESVSNSDAIALVPVHAPLRG